MRARLKAQYLEEMVLDIRAIIKENTYEMSVIDMETEVLAFSLKKFDEYLKANQWAPREEQEDMRRQILHEASAAMQELHGMYAEGPVSTTKEWYDDASADMMSSYGFDSQNRSVVFYKEYFRRLANGGPCNVMELIGFLTQ